MLQFTRKTLESLGLLNSVPHGGFDRQTHIAKIALAAETSLMSVIDDQNDQQFFRSSCAVPEPLRHQRATPLSHSFCKLVRDMDAPLVISDSRRDARVKDNPAVSELGVISYLGAPIHDPSGKPIGSLCVFNSVPRDWSQADQTMIQELAAVVDEQILLIDAIRDRDRAMAAAEREAEARNKLAAFVSHEVRTPLNGVMGLAQILAEEVMDPAHQVRLQAILDSSNVMLHLLNDLLDLSKMEAGKLDLDLAPFRPIDLANKLDLIYSSMADRKGLDLEILTNPGASALWIGDQMRITQILQNLINNSMKFTQSGTISVRFNCVPGRSFRVSVSDTGIGMTQAAAEAAFTDFCQADPTISRRFGGTGLGLSIVKHLVTAMGGTISVDSVEGKGTAFHIELPLEVLETPDEPLSPAPLSAVSGMTVLAVDDNASNLIVIKAMLERHKLRVHTARDGMEAVEMVQSGRYAAVFMDIAMPRMDGTAAAHAIRAAEANNDHPPIPLIAVTADTGHLTTYRDDGFNDVISKPIRSNDIAEAVRTHVLPPAVQGQAGR